MYSVVVMMVMSGAPEMPAFGGSRGCHGGGGCNGYVATSCWGGSGCHGGRGGLFGGRGCHGGGGWACNGGNGGCWGGNSCHGGRGHGLFGGRGCHGGHGCNGGGGCWGGSNWGCTGGSGCQGYVAAGCGCCGGYASATGGAVMMGAATTAPATIVVNLPAEAKITFDGAATTSTGTSRRFVTPAINNGIEHNYTIGAEIVRDGKTLKTSQVVTVRAGQTTEVNLADASFTTTVAAN